ncbi:hypothetical protein WJX75_008564 [Coccomyxa subellipsoidea]|uniref:SAGA-associated factor 11 n=1 Tax=Coccomyxa subellipsoidea TaxID=248742 RepID=A0ABR2YYE1_9CHLO
MAVDVRQEISNVDRLHKELADEVAGLPGALQSFTPELLVDYLAATFKECDSESRSCKAQEEAAVMDAAAERIHATIRETERTSVTSVEEMGLPEGVEDEKGLMLVRCKTCARVLLAGSCAAHEEHCRAPPAPFRPAASPGPSSTTASVPASSGPASISQGKPAPARRKKAASVPKSKLGPGKKQAAAATGKPLPCSMVARQPPQLMRPPLYPGPAKIPNNFLGGGLDDFAFGASLDWLDPGGALPPAAATSTTQTAARAAAAKPAQTKGPAQAPTRQGPTSNTHGPFLPHPQRPRSTMPKRRLARMQRVAQMGQPALLNGPRVSMQRLGPDFMPISPMGCADGGSAEAANPLKRSFSGDAGLPPPTKKLASLQQLHHTTLPVLRRPEDFKPF